LNIENKEIIKWIKEIQDLCKPKKILIIDGSEKQLEILRNKAIKEGEIEKLDNKKFPNCFLHRTMENDVARVEDKTYICTETKEEAGPTNNWMRPKEAYTKLRILFKESMKNKTMYVIPFMMGPPKSQFTKFGIEITDSIYVVLNMCIMTRVNKTIMNEIKDNIKFTKCLHSKKDINLDERYIMHFPKDNTIWSINSAYGGNALLGKKCLALRIASYMAKNEGWLAEHMLILGIEKPNGEICYLAAAFPSACGKTNLAMLIPPKKFKDYKIWTVGDDIAWLKIGEDGRLWALNPENGFFGVATGTSAKTNLNALETVKKNSIFTNVLKKDDNIVWWEGMDEEVPEHGIDWKGKEWTPNLNTKGAHPNSRFTSPANQCPCISAEWENPNGVPLSAIIFGGRRAELTPLVYESFNWNHGIFVGASMSSETTAASNGNIGVVRRDPMAMLPFCGYNMADYFAHWFEIGKKITNPPKIFNVNWFRINKNNEFMWPGYRENFRILKWIIDRCENNVSSLKTEIGYLPLKTNIDWSELDIDDNTINELFKINKKLWMNEIEDLEIFFKNFGEKMPNEIGKELKGLSERFGDQKFA
jgi:phosphoenolpyruvate carboxykinase (GTP)